MNKKITLAAALMVSILLLGACASTDVIGKESINSFDDLLNAVPDRIEKDEMNGGWALNSPDGSARFIWSEDYSAGTPHDVMIEFDSKPFIDAGLDTSKLPLGMAIQDKIMVGKSLGYEKLTYEGDATPLKSFEKIVELKRDSIKYHADLDHYGVDVGGKNAFEWAKDMAVNDKDVVFALDPEIFIEAGVNPEKVEGWIFGKVKIMNEDGDKVEVDKFLKPFDIL